MTGLTALLFSSSRGEVSLAPCPFLDSTLRLCPLPDLRLSCLHSWQGHHSHSVGWKTGVAPGHAAVGTPSLGLPCAPEGLPVLQNVSL